MIVETTKEEIRVSVKAEAKVLIRVGIKVSIKGLIKVKMGVLDKEEIKVSAKEIKVIIMEMEAIIILAINQTKVSMSLIQVLLNRILMQEVHTSTMAPIFTSLRMLNLSTGINPNNSMTI